MRPWLWTEIVMLSLAVLLVCCEARADTQIGVDSASVASDDRANCFNMSLAESWAKRYKKLKKLGATAKDSLKIAYDISLEGLVSKAEVIDSSGSREIDQAALYLMRFSKAPATSLVNGCIPLRGYSTFEKDSVRTKFFNYSP